MNTSDFRPPTSDFPSTSDFQPPTSNFFWWQKGVLYQIYPRSFQDSNGDGVGDLPGITARLDYLEWLGVDALWLSPIFPSPMADFGYDISDYCGVDPLFGTLRDFDELLAAAHSLGLKLLLDFVPNHTSEAHAWFRASRSSRDDPQRDWYLWRDPAPDGGPPNNWLSVFGGSAWTYGPATGQYYYHAFLPQQPDLNWRNPEVREAMEGVLRFWLDRGVDGFRADALWHVIKDDLFRDNPPNPHPGRTPYGALLPVYTADRPEVFEVVAAMRRVIDSYPDRVLIGEIYLPVERLVAYYGTGTSGGGPGLHLPFNFQLIKLPWDAGVIRRAVDAYEALLPPGGWPNWVLGNHDKSRIASRVGAAQARVAAMLLLTLRGMPTLYYGDEIGMEDVPIPPERVQDPYEKNVPGVGVGRDPARTPLPWDSGPGAGFTRGEPWLPLAADFRSRNVAVEREDPRSLLSLCRRLIALRRAEPALSVGEYAPLESEGPVLAFARRAGGRHLAVFLNFSASRQLRSAGTPEGRILLSTALDREGEPVGPTLDLRPNEGLLLETR